MTKSFLWTASSSKILPKEPVKLQDPTTLLPDQTVIKETDQLTISIRGVMIPQSEDFKALLIKDPSFLNKLKTNDLIIMTTYQMGSDPTIDKLHFLQENVPTGWQGDFFDRVIISTNDLKNDSITLEIKVYDLDGIKPEFIEAVASLGESVAKAFPVLGNVTQISPKILRIFRQTDSLLNLINTLDTHDKIINQRLSLVSGEENKAYKLLQPGYFICFSKEIEEELYLDSQLHVVKPDTNNSSSFVNFDSCSYAVLEISKNFSLERAQEIDQKVAKLMSEISGKGNSGEAALKFLRETVDGYDMYNTLRQAQEIESKGDKATEAEKVRLEKLKTKLEADPYLKKFVNK